MIYKCFQRATGLFSMIFTFSFLVFTGDFVALAQLPHYDAMAPSSRPHPYRATSTVDTPQGPRSAAWIAGHGCLPGDIDPPPPRPVLVLVDYSPLQELTHRSQPDHALYSVLTNSNFRNVSPGELEALFTWARHYQPIEAGIFPFRDLRTALTTRLRTQWDIHMVPSDLEFRYADLPRHAFRRGDP